MLLIESKPNDSELQSLKAKYGEPFVRRIDRKDVSNQELTSTDCSTFSKCKGEGVVLIFDKSDRLLLVKKRGENRWFLPSGRIWSEEDIEAGTIREAKEETGLDVELKKMPAIHIVDLHFQNGILRLWHFIFIAESCNNHLRVQDNFEIDDCRFFKSFPKENSEFEKEWIEIVLEDV